MGDLKKVLKKAHKDDTMCLELKLRTPLLNNRGEIGMGYSSEIF